MTLNEDNLDLSNRNNQNNINENFLAEEENFPKLGKYLNEKKLIDEDFDLLQYKDINTINFSTIDKNDYLNYLKKNILSQIILDNSLNPKINDKKKTDFYISLYIKLNNISIEKSSLSLDEFTRMLAIYNQDEFTSINNVLTLDEKIKRYKEFLGQEQKINNNKNCENKLNYISKQKKRLLNPKNGMSYITEIRAQSLPENKNKDLFVFCLDHNNGTSFESHIDRIYNDVTNKINLLNQTYLIEKINLLNKELIDLYKYEDEEKEKIEKTIIDLGKQLKKSKENYTTATKNRRTRDNNLLEINQYYKEILTITKKLSEIEEHKNNPNDKTSKKELILIKLIEFNIQLAQYTNPEKIPDMLIEMILDGITYDNIKNNTSIKNFIEKIYNDNQYKQLNPSKWSIISLIYEGKSSLEKTLSITKNIISNNTERDYEQAYDTLNASDSSYKIRMDIRLLNNLKLFEGNKQESILSKNTMKIPVVGKGIQEMKIKISSDLAKNKAFLEALKVGNSKGFVVENVIDQEGYLVLNKDSIKLIDKDDTGSIIVKNTDGIVTKTISDQELKEGKEQEKRLMRILLTNGELKKTQELFGSFATKIKPFEIILESSINGDQPDTATLNQIRKDLLAIQDDAKSLKASMEKSIGELKQIEQYLGAYGDQEIKDLIQYFDNINNFFKDGGYIDKIVSTAFNSRVLSDNQLRTLIKNHGPQFVGAVGGAVLAILLAPPTLGGSLVVGAGLMTIGSMVGGRIGQDVSDQIYSLNKDKVVINKDGKILQKEIDRDNSSDVIKFYNGELNFRDFVGGLGLDFIQQFSMQVVFMGGGRLLGGKISNFIKSPKYEKFGGGENGYMTKFIEKTMPSFKNNPIQDIQNILKNNSSGLQKFIRVFPIELGEEIFEESVGQTGIQLGKNDPTGIVGQLGNIIALYMSLTPKPGKNYFIDGKMCIESKSKDNKSFVFTYDQSYDIKEVIDHYKSKNFTVDNTSNKVSFEGISITFKPTSEPIGLRNLQLNLYNAEKNIDGTYNLQSTSKTTELKQKLIKSGYIIKDTEGGFIALTKNDIKAEKNQIPKVLIFNNPKLDERRNPMEQKTPLLENLSPRIGSHIRFGEKFNIEDKYEDMIRLNKILPNNTPKVTKITNENGKTTFEVEQISGIPLSQYPKNKLNLIDYIMLRTLIRALYNNNFFHGDIAGRNIIIQEQSDGSKKFYLIDPIGYGNKENFVSKNQEGLQMEHKEHIKKITEEYWNIIEQSSNIDLNEITILFNLSSFILNKKLDIKKDFDIESFNLIKKNYQKLLDGEKKLTQYLIQNPDKIYDKEYQIHKTIKKILDYYNQTQAYIDANIGSVSVGDILIFDTGERYEVLKNNDLIKIKNMKTNIESDLLDNDREKIVNIKKKINWGKNIENNESKDIVDIFWPQGVNQEIIQGNIGDCYLLGTIIQMKNMPFFKEKMRKMIQPVDGGYVLHFPNSYYIHNWMKNYGPQKIFLSHGDIYKRQKSGLGLSSGSIGDIILELGYAKLRNICHSKQNHNVSINTNVVSENIFFKGPNNKYPIEGGVAEEVLLNFFGNHLIDIRKEVLKKNVINVLKYLNSFLQHFTKDTTNSLRLGFSSNQNKYNLIYNNKFLCEIDISDINIEFLLDRFLSMDRDSRVKDEIKKTQTYKEFFNFCEEKGIKNHISKNKDNIINDWNIRLKNDIDNIKRFLSDISKKQVMYISSYGTGDDTKHNVVVGVDNKKHMIFKSHAYAVINIDQKTGDTTIVNVHDTRFKKFTISFNDVWKYFNSVTHYNVGIEELTHDTELENNIKNDDLDFNTLDFIKKDTNQIRELLFKTLYFKDKNTRHYLALEQENLITKINNTLSSKTIGELNTNYNEIISILTTKNPNLGTFFEKAKLKDLFFKLIKKSK